MFFWFSKGGFANFSGYDNPAVTDLLRSARALADRESRGRLYREAQALIAGDCPVLFLHFDAVLQAGTARLRWTAYPDGVLRLNDARMA